MVNPQDSKLRLAFGYMVLARIVVNADCESVSVLKRFVELRWIRQITSRQTQNKHPEKGCRRLDLWLLAGLKNGEDRYAR